MEVVSVFDEQLATAVSELALGGIHDVPDLLRMHIQDRRDHPLLIWIPAEGEERSYTYGEFYHCVIKAARELADRGIKEGDRVIVHLDNCPEALVIWHACAEIGAVSVCTSTRSTRDDLRYIIELATPLGAVTSRQYAGILSDLFSACEVNVTCDELVNASNPGDTVNQSAELQASRPEAGLSKRAKARSQDDLTIHFTSGTTSRPKGVVWTHMNAVWGARTSAAHEGLSADDVHLVFFPLFHVNAKIYSYLASLWAGGTVVLMPSFSAAKFWDVSVRYRCTWAAMVQFTIEALRSRAIPTNHSYRIWGCARCDDTVDRVFRLKTIGWWGMTETISQGIIGKVDAANRSGAIGVPAPEYEIKIVGGSGERVIPGQSGRLLIRGEPGVSLFKRYYRDEAATRAAFDADGWFDTQDCVTLHEENFISFSDRIKDIIRVGGENVSSAEIESVIMLQKEVVAVAVVARPHRSFVEQPVAFVVTHPGNDERDLRKRISALCRSRLARFKIPRRIFFVDALPRSLLNKVNKAQLREIARNTP